MATQRARRSPVFIHLRTHHPAIACSSLRLPVLEARYLDAPGPALASDSRIAEADG